MNDYVTVFVFVFVFSLPSRFPPVSVTLNPLLISDHRDRRVSEPRIWRCTAIYERGGGGITTDVKLHSSWSSVQIKSEERKISLFSFQSFFGC